MDIGRSNPRTFNLTYRYLSPVTSFTDEGRIEIGLTPKGADHSEAWIRVDGGLARALLGLEVDERVVFLIDEPHREGFFVQPVPDATGAQIDDYLLRIPHFSTPWVTMIGEHSTTYNDVWQDPGTSPFYFPWIVGNGRVITHDFMFGWQDVSPPNPGTLLAIYGDGVDTKFVAGYAGKVWKRVGTTWTDASSAAATGWGVASNMLTVKDITFLDGKFYFVGTDTTNGFCFIGCQAFIGTYDVSTGTYARANTNGVTGDLRAIWGSSGSDIWAVGEKGTGQYTQDGLALRYTGGTWQVVATPGGGPNNYRNSLHGTSATNLYAGGVGGDVWKYSGSWTQAADSSNDLWNDVQATSSDIVWAAGCQNGCSNMHQGVQGSWADVPIDTAQSVNAMSGSSVKSVWAVGSGGLIIKYPGAAPRQPSLSSPAQNAVNINPTGFTMTTSAAIDPDLDAVTYRFFVSTAYADLQPNGSLPAPKCDGASTSCAASSLAGNAYHYWRVDACDTDNRCSQSAVWTFKTAPLPEARICSVTQPTPQDRSITADGTCSTNPGGGSLTYDWDWKDTTTHGTTATASHTYTTVCPTGSFSIRLTVTNSAGVTHFVEKPIVVEDKRDGDGDDLVDCREALQGTSVSDKDSDDDGLQDDWESLWWPSRSATFCNGASTCADADAPKPTVRDLYVEIDWMAGHSLDPSQRTTILNSFADAPMNTDGNPANDIRFHLDTGDLGGGEELAFQDYTSETDYNVFYKNDLDDLRKGKFRYGIIACKDSAVRGTTAPSWGWAKTPGQKFAIFDCERDMNDADAQAKEIMHELGHNLLGWRITDVPACQDDQINGQSIVLRNNPGLTTHFDVKKRPVIDCQSPPDGVPDVYNHPSSHDDVVAEGGPDGKNIATYHAATWAALKLDFGVTGTIRDHDCGWERSGEFPLQNESEAASDAAGFVTDASCLVVYSASTACPTPYVGLEPNCMMPPESCSAPRVGVEPDCIDPAEIVCPLPQVGVWPDCVNPPSECAENQVGLEPACQPMPAECSNPEAVGIGEACAHVCSSPTVGVTVAGTLRCLTPPEPCPMPTVGIGSLCINGPEGCPSGSVGVVWYGVASMCKPQPQLCSIPGVGVEPTCVTACAPPQLGIIIGEFVVCVPTPQLCPPGSFGVEWDPSFQVTACFSLCSGGTAGVDGVVCVGPHSKCADFPDLAMVCVIECAAGEVGAEPVCFDPCSLVVGDCPPQLCPLTEPGVEPNCVDPDDPCSLLPMPSSATLVGVDCVGLCSPPRVGIVVGDRAVCLNPPTVPSCIGTALVCFNPQTRCIQSSTALNNICLPNPF